MTQYLQIVDKKVINAYKNEYKDLCSKKLYRNCNWLFPLLYITNIQTKEEPQKTVNVSASVGNIFVQKKKLDLKSHAHLNLLQDKPKERKVKCCYLCYFLLENCFANRHKVLTFQTPQTQGMISKLSSIPLSEWGLAEFKKLVHLYMKNKEKANEIEFLQKPSVLEATPPKKRRMSLSHAYFNKKYAKERLDQQQGCFGKFYLSGYSFECI